MKRMKTAAKSLLGQRSKSGQLSGSSSGAPIASGLPNNPVPLASSTGPDTISAIPKSDSESTSEDNSLNPSGGKGCDARQEKPTDTPSVPVGERSIMVVAEPARESTELDKAIDQFEMNYKQFSKKYVLIDKDLVGAFQTATKGDDIKHTAKIFGENVLTTLKSVERKKGIARGNWINQVGQFLTKLYPLASLVCGLTAAVAEVPPM